MLSSRRNAHFSIEGVQNSCFACSEGLRWGPPHDGHKKCPRSFQEQRFLSQTGPLHFSSFLGPREVWKPIRNQWKSMKSSKNHWTIIEKQWKSMKRNENQWKSIKRCVNQWKTSLKINEHQWTINANQWKSNDKHWKSNEINENQITSNSFNWF